MIQSKLMRSNMEIVLSLNFPDWLAQALCDLFVQGHEGVQG